MVPRHNVLLCKDDVDFANEIDASLRIAVCKYFDCANTASLRIAVCKYCQSIAHIIVTHGPLFGSSSCGLLIGEPSTTN